MADRKITDLAELTSPVAADLLPIVVAAEPTAANKNKKIQYGTFLRNIPSGTIGAPSIAWTADSGVTGFYRSAANEIAFTANSTFQGKFTTAGFQLGTGTAAAQLHLFSADTTDQVIIENTDAGLDTAPDVVLYRNSASPANNDNLGNLEFRGKDSAGNDQTYAQILSTISTVTNTSEVGILDLMSADAGVSAMRLRLKGQYVGISESNPIYPLHVSSTVSSTALQLQCTVNDASSGGDITMYRRRGAATVGQNNDLLSTIYWRGHNNNATTEQVDYAAITGSIVDVTNNAEFGELELKVIANGTLTTRLAIDNAAIITSLPLRGQNGSVSAPAFSFSGDTNTGIYSTGVADEIAITTGGTQALLIDVSGNSTFAGNIRSSSATGGVGYTTGAGGTVTQITSRTTGVTLNKICGAITLVSAAGSTTWQSFTVTNSTVAATDNVIVNQRSGTNLYMIHVTAVAAGSFRITFATTGGTTTEQPVFNFSVVKAVAA